VLNEKDTVTVIAQLPTSVDLATADLQLRNGVLKVRLCRRSRKGTEVGSGDGHQR
jgi:HSP20 family molecular chaperone IbpA